ncbi:MAG: class I SAM-dependent methyltransferase [Leptolyngbya sp. SIOISBB]|nr:class I SAM-dependent methyltransferase [Leptolyngbya sp. SIOISBB]
MSHSTLATTVFSGVPRTLLLTTRARVDEHQRPHGILHDPMIAEWWPALTWDPALDGLYQPLGQLGWALRAHVFDEIVQRHLAVRSQAVVVELGAGLSTRYYRVGQQSHAWLELDLPPVIHLRHQLEAESDRYRLIPCSVVDWNWMDEVPECPPESVLILAEGLLMYLGPDEVQALITQLKQRFAGATLVFDAVGGLTRGRTAKQLASVDAPLKWFVNHERDLTAMGLTVVEARSLIQEMCRYRDRIGGFRWVPWLSKLPPFRNASLLIESRV